jgi:hypothetical protein
MRPSFGNALVENICTGCTAVINRALADMLRTEHPAFTTMHDRWFYLVASCFGEVIYDTEPFIYYRQHGSNTVGMKQNHRQEFADRLRKYRRKRHDIAKQTQAFLTFCAHNDFEIPDEKKAYAEDILAIKQFRSRIRLIKNDAIYRQRKDDDRIFKILIMFGCL